MWPLLDLVALSVHWSLTASSAARGMGGAATPSGAVRFEPARLEESLEARLEASGSPDPAPQAAELRRLAARQLWRAEALGVCAVPYGADAYPAALLDITDPPPLLWARGTLVPAAHAVAIVGSRAATPHALEVAYRLAEGLAAAGVTVVSGMARGVDGEAHRGALAGDGPTVAVLGCGVDVVYPPEHAVLAGRIAATGALVSELVPGTPPLGWHFPRRNRIIAGLSAGVVVVEAAARSGSLSTARHAADQGRAVMAVPGGVLSGRNRGAHALLRDGARIVETADDILEELHFVGAPAILAARRAGGPEPPNDRLLRSMRPGEPYDLASLQQRTGVEMVRLLGWLAELEVGGWVRRADGGRFVRAGANVLR